MLRSIFVATCLVGIGSLSVSRGEGGTGQDIVDTAIAAGSIAALPKGTLEALLKDKQKLASVITYHLIPGRALSTDVMKLESEKSAQGELLSIKDTNDVVHLNAAKVLKTDILCTNDVIHLIDRVLLPPRSTPPAVMQAKSVLHSAAEIEPAKQIAELKRVVGEVLKSAGKNVLAKEVLKEALAQAAELEEQEATMLAQREAVQILEFTPFQEAELPQGLPEFIPVGEIQLKTYPSIAWPAWQRTTALKRAALSSPCSSTLFATELRRPPRSK